MYFLFLFFTLCSFFTHAQSVNRAPVIDTSLRPFYHGVASGDPMEDRVMIWTRVTPQSGAVTQTEVYWQIATDPQFQQVVNWGKILATESNDWCVKVDVCNLQPNTFYYYVFENEGRKSITARTKTAPAAQSDNDSARFAVVSCASYEHGYFNAYQSISNRNDVDAVLHLGDYIYEYATGDFSANINGRTYDPPAEAITASGYRLRHSQYKLDPQLRRIHQLFPFITVWDDHETCNDAWSYGGENHNPGEGSYLDRKAASTSAYFQWMPLRKPDPLDTLRIFRKLRYGRLLDLVMLDTRLYDRDEQDAAQSNNANHHMMGPVERAWFLQQLGDTSTRWKIIGNQVMFAPLEIFGQPVNADQWDGYNYERQIIQSFIQTNNVKNMVILTGDIHTSWCNDIPGPNYNSNGNGSLAVEFVGPSVTSFNLPLPVGSNLIQLFNNHMKYINLQSKGYYTLSVNKNRAQADYTFVDELNPNAVTETAGPRYKTDHLSSKLTQVNQPAPASAFSAPLPALTPDQSLSVVKFQSPVYLTIPENQSADQIILPDADVCPAFVYSLSDSANHGEVFWLNATDVRYTPESNYYGADTFAYVFCQNTQSACDTVVVIVQVMPDNDIEIQSVFTDKDSTFTACVAFNDLTASPQSIVFSGLAAAQVIVTDSCYSVSFDSAYCGKDTLQITGCDALGFCDTLLVIFRVNHATALSVEELTVTSGSTLQHAYTFDDLLGCVTPAGISRPPQHGLIPTFTDSQFVYQPFAGYVGADTMVVIRCDTCPAPNCDTILFAIRVTETVAVSEMPSEIVVLSIFPNPADEHIHVQFYVPDAEPVRVSMLDIQGREVMRKTHKLKQPGVQQIFWQTSTYPPGSYQLVLQYRDSRYVKSLLLIHR